MNNKEKVSRNKKQLFFLHLQFEGKKVHAAQIKLANEYKFDVIQSLIGRQCSASSFRDFCVSSTIKFVATKKKKKIANSVTTKITMCTVYFGSLMWWFFFPFISMVFFGWIAWNERAQAKPMEKKCLAFSLGRYYNPNRFFLRCILWCIYICVCECEE